LSKDGEAGEQKEKKQGCWTMLAWVRRLTLAEWCECGSVGPRLMRASDQMRALFLGAGFSEVHAGVMRVSVGPGAAFDDGRRTRV
jgi:hypothetical protein